MRQIPGSCGSCLVPSSGLGDVETSGPFFPPNKYMPDLGWGRGARHSCSGWCCQLRINTTETDPENYFLLMEELSGPEQSDLRAFRSTRGNILESSFNLLSPPHCPSGEGSAKSISSQTLCWGRAHTSGLKTIGSQKSGLRMTELGFVESSTIWGWKHIRNHPAHISHVPDSYTEAQREMTCQRSMVTRQPDKKLRLFFLIEVELIDNHVLVSGVQQSDSDIYIDIYIYSFSDAVSL